MLGLKVQPLSSNCDFLCSYCFILSFFWLWARVSNSLSLLMDRWLWRQSLEGEFSLVFGLKVHPRSSSTTFFFSFSSYITCLWIFSWWSLSKIFFFPWLDSSMSLMWPGMEKDWCMGRVSFGWTSKLPRLLLCLLFVTALRPGPPSEILWGLTDLTA